MINYIFSNYIYTVFFSILQPKPKLLRRQKSTSEIETRIPVPEPEEESMWKSLFLRNTHTP